MKTSNYWYNLESEFNTEDLLYLESEFNAEDLLYLESERLTLKVCNSCIKSKLCKKYNNPKGLCLSCATQNNNITKHLS